MKYDFTSIMDRHGKDAIAVDGLGTGFAPAAPKEGFDAIPMWVADMNFPTVPTIQEAIIERTNHPAFGYFDPTDEYFDSIIRWQAKRNGVQGLTKECIGYENGVLGGVISALNCVCSKGDKILIHSPTYIGFTMSLKNNGYEAVHSPLVKDENGVWRMDFEDMEKHLKEEKIHAAIMCNPHNPCGRVWERWELEKAMELYKKYDVYVVSDEIWSDIILSGNKHIPTQSVSEDARQRTAAFYAPSKTFNLAGLVGSYHIVYNNWWRDRIEKESSLSHYNMMNVLSMHALIGAYKPEGYEWTDELCEVLTGNIDFACDYIFWHRADHAALAQTAQLERGIHGNGQAAAVGFDLNDLCRPQNGKHLSQLDKVQGLNGGLNLLLTVVLKIEQGLMQRVIGGPFAGLRFLLLQHIPRKLQLEFAIICVAELVAQPGDRGFGRVAGLCKLRRGGDRGPLYICKNAVRNAPFGAVKLEPGAQLGDDASRGIVHSNTSLCALCIGHNAQYSGNSIPIFW